VELVGAAVHSGMTETAADAYRRLTETTSPAGTDWALGLAARSRALLSDSAQAEEGYREAISRLDRPRSAWSWPALTCSTGNGCGGRTGAPTPGAS